MKEFREFAQNIAIYLGSNIARSALPFLMLPFLIRELGTEEYGKVGLITAAFTLISVVIGLGTHGFIRTSYTQCTESEMKELLGNAVVLVSMMCLPILLLLLLLIDQTTVFPAFPAAYVLIGVLSAFAQKLISFQLVLWQMSNHARKYGVLSFCMTLLNLTFSIALVFVVGLKAEGRVLGMWLPAIFMGPCFLLIMLHRNAIRFSINPKILRKILSYGLPLIPHALALAGIVFIERAALSGSSETTALGIFFAAFQLSMPVSIAVNSVNLQFRAWSDRRMVSGDHKAVVAASYLLMATFLLFALFYAWILGYFYGDIVGKEAASGYPISVILVFSAAFRGFYLVVVKGLFFSNNTSLLMYISVLLSTVFSLFLLFYNELYTVAYLNLAFNFCLFICVWIASIIVYPQPWFFHFAYTSTKRKSR